jgi:hypothetical protein
LPLISRPNRAETEKLPPVIHEDEDVAATMPMHPNMLGALRPKPVPEKPDSVTGTVFLPANAPIPSPEPAWKKEMAQRLEVHRQTLSIPAPDLQTRLLEFEHATGSDAAGGTQLVDTEGPHKRPDVAAARSDAGLSRPEFAATRPEFAATRPDYSVRPDITGTTSTASTMSQEIASPGKLLTDPAVTTGGTKRKRRNNRLFVMAMGGLGGLAICVVVVFLFRGVLKAKQASTAIIPEASSVVPMPMPPITSDAVVPASAQPPGAVGPAVVSSAASTFVPETNPVPSATVAPVETNSPPPPTKAPLPTNPPPTNPPPVKTSAPAKTGGTTKKSQWQEVCTGVGVFQRCKKVLVP